MKARPHFSHRCEGADLIFRLDGTWTLAYTPDLEIEGRALETRAKDAEITRIILDMALAQELDTSGAWVICTFLAAQRLKGHATEIINATAQIDQLLKETEKFVEGPSCSIAPRPGWNFVRNLGKAVVGLKKDIFNDLAFLGRVIISLIGLMRRPKQIRFTPIVYHLESFAYHAIPIIVLINFLVGCIVAQQGIFQLRRFGAGTFVVDLVGILILREFAVLLTSIMVAGRTGSAITAELGSMKMREEVDALRVMGIDPLSVLVLPRLIALIIAVPLLTFIADIASILGGLLVSWGYGGLHPNLFLARLKDAVALNTFFVGLIKAPVMAFAVGLISSREGLEVKGSAESLGQHVTISVVRSIFVVVLLDGIFAMFFAFLNY